MMRAVFSTRRLFVWLAAFVFITLGAGAARAGEPERKMRVVATFSIVADVVRNVAGDRIELITLVGPDADAHTYEPTPSDTREIARADLLFENGLGFESWIDKLYAASKSSALRVSIMKPAKVRRLADDDHDHHGHDHDHGEIDPHAWQDVRNVVAAARMVEGVLAKRDPAGAEAYRANADAYVKSLEELDAAIVKITQALPRDRRRLVTSHDSLGYFAERYGFEIIGSALHSVTTESSEPSAKLLAQVIRQVRAAKVPAVFVENMANPKVMRQIAREAKVEVVGSLYTDALGKPGSRGATYVQMMRANAEGIVAALSK